MYVFTVSYEGTVIKKTVSCKLIYHIIDIIFVMTVPS
jgi:hypothetical protein